LLPSLPLPPSLNFSLTSYLPPRENQRQQASSEHKP
jgi:hypothetical protein